MADKEVFNPPAGPSKNPPAKHVSSKQRFMAYNLYLDPKQGNSKSAAVKLAAKQLGLGERTMLDIVKEMDITGLVSSRPKKRLRHAIYDSLDETQKSTIRRHVHSFVLMNELPTCTKILSNNIMEDLEEVGV